MAVILPFTREWITMAGQPFRKVRLNNSVTFLGSGDGASPSIKRTYWTTGRVWDALVISQNNPKRGGRYVGGGPFFVHKRSEIVAPSLTVDFDYVAPSPHKGLRYRSTAFIPSQAPRGQDVPPLLPDWSIPDWPPLQNALIPYGATGFARARPGNALADSFVAAGELFKEGLPRVPLMIARRLRTLSSLGSEYLNVVFGWMPLIASIDDMLKTAQAQQRVIQQLIRDHGRLVRRRRELGTQKTSSVSVQNYSNLGAFWPAMANTQGGVGGSSSRLETMTVSITRRWFEGGFRYHIPGYSTRDFSWIPRMRRRLYGADITPEAIYNLMPWSWLIDWFTNYGDILKNISRNAVGHPVAEYAFVMMDTDVSTTRTARGYLPAGSAGGIANGKSYDLTSVWEQRSHNKARVPATPYGFGITYDGLSDQQKAILAALGISRARF